MPRRRNHRSRRRPRPLSASIAERIGELRLPPARPRLPHLHQEPPRALLPSRSTRDVLAVLAAATGLAVACASDAVVELLPSSPTTIVITRSGRADAVFVLPISRQEALAALGRPAAAAPDAMFDRLWEEDRVAEMVLPDAALEDLREGTLAC